MAILKIITFLVSFIWASTSIADSPCFSNNKISFSPEILNYYFSNDNAIKILPLGNTKCDFENKNINLYNSETGSIVANLEITQIIKTPFYNIAIDTKLTNPLIISKTIFTNKKIDRIKFMYLLNLYINPKTPLNFNNDIFFAVVKIKNLNFKNIAWSPYLDFDKHWAAKIINYENLIQFFSNKETKYVHAGDLNTYYLPIINNELIYRSNQNTYKYPVDDLIPNIKMGASIKETLVVVLSSTAFNTEGYNTVTKLYLAGYRNIFWFKDSTLAWRDTLESNKVNNYDTKYSTLTNQKLLDLFKTKSPFFVLDLSDESIYKQVHFKKSIREYPVYFSPERIEEFIKNSPDPQAYKNYANTTYSVVGRHAILNADKLFPKNAKVVLVTNNHYSNSYVAKSIYDQLSTEGYSPSILETSTGEFLSYLISNSLDSKDLVYEQKDLFYTEPN